MLTIIVAFLASAAGTWLFIDWLKKRNLVAHENDRTMHSGAVPQGGGAPVIAAAIGATLLQGPGTPALEMVLAIAAGLAVLSADNDRRDIAFPLRLAAHAVAAFLALTFLPAAHPVLGGWFPIWLDRLLVLIALVWFINLYNFMDGIDGIAGIETISIAVGALAVSRIAGGVSDLDGLTCAILGASAGFLVWNWHKARIFLGDVGSIPLGFVTGVILIQLAVTHSLAAALILPLYYLSDATLTLLRRFSRGEKVWLAHREHTYQRAARAVGSHSAIVLRIAACNVVLILAAVLALSVPLIAFAIAVAAVGVLMRHLEGLAAGVAP